MDNLNSLLDGETKINEVKPQEVVRLRTSYWADDRGLHIRKDLTYLRSKSKGFSFLKEEISNIGAEETVSMIENLFEKDDGIYRVVFIPGPKDYWTGYIEDWSYKLEEFDGN